MHVSSFVLAAIALSVGFAAGHTTSTAAPPQPGKEHRWLASLAGDYTAKVGGALGNSDATMRADSSLGFWSVREFSGRMMNQPFQGREILGYDPLKKKYVGVWVDSMNPLLTYVEGDYDAKKKTLTMSGISRGLDGGKAQMVNTTTFTKDGMKFVMKLEGHEGAFMTIDYKRKKSVKLPTRKKK